MSVSPKVEDILRRYRRAIAELERRAIEEMSLTTLQERSGLPPEYVVKYTLPEKEPEAVAVIH